MATSARASGGGALAGFRAHAALIIAVTLMIGFGVWLRAQRLGYPDVMTWDEHHFVVNARAYLTGQPDGNDHPPLGKLLMAQLMHSRGDDAVSWRLPSLLLGCASVLFAGALARWARGTASAFFFGAALVAIDGFFISYSRVALLDGMLASLCLAAMSVTLSSRTPLGVAAGAALLGSACAVKFSAIVLVPVLLWAALSKPRPVWSGVATLFAPVTYVGWYAWGLSLSQRPAGPMDVFAETKRLYLHHAALTHWKHPALTHWYEWFLPKKPLLLRANTLEDGRVKMLSSLGNPLLWWLVDLAVLVVAVALIAGALGYLKKRGVRSALGGVRGLLDTPAGKRLALLLLWAAPVAPWILSKRDSYLYHYLPAYAFGTVLVATLLDALYQRARIAGLLLLLVIAQVSFYYSPIWGQLPLTPHGIQDRLFIKSWRG